MIKDFFGLSTGNFIKVYILVAFLFIFLRIVYLAINFIKGKSKSELKKLFFGTEFILWALLLLWIYHSIPSHKLIFLISIVIFLSLNTVIWFGIRQRLAGVVFNKVYNVYENKLLKINSEIYQISKLFLNSFDANKNGKIIKFQYYNATKQTIETQKTTEFDIKITENSNFNTQEELEEILIENNFITENSTLIIEVDENDKTKWLIQFKSFDEKQKDDIEEFIKEIE